MHACFQSTWWDIKRWIFFLWELNSCIDRNHRRCQYTLYLKVYSFLISLPTLVDVIAWWIYIHKFAFFKLSWYQSLFLNPNPSSAVSPLSWPCYRISPPRPCSVALFLKPRCPLVPSWLDHGSDQKSIKSRPPLLACDLTWRHHRSWPRRPPDDITDQIRSDRDLNRSLPTRFWKYPQLSKWVSKGLLTTLSRTFCLSQIFDSFTELSKALQRYRKPSQGLLIALFRTFCLSQIFDSFAELSKALLPGSII